MAWEFSSSYCGLTFYILAKGVFLYRKPKFI